METQWNSICIVHECSFVRDNMHMPIVFNKMGVNKGLVHLYAPFTPVCGGCFALNGASSLQLKAMNGRLTAPTAIYM